MTLVLKDISYSFMNENQQPTKVLSGLNLTIAQGEFVSMIGRSGTGKSTILKLITGLLTPEEGKIPFMESQLRWGMSAICPSATCSSLGGQSLTI